ncbi:MAG: type IV pilus twitching motility protein PilT [Geodermatophilaceae bacterium]|nr:type IV pilus twitching motility protein PilT [Geodermatophilaceae bacterium]
MKGFDVLQDAPIALDVATPGPPKSPSLATVVLPVRRPVTERVVAVGELLQDPPEAESSRIGLDELLTQMVDLGGSDLHLTAAAPPTIRLRGDMTAVPGYGPLEPRMLEEALYSILTDKQRALFEERHELDFAYVIPGKSRFRANIFRQRGSMGAVLRGIPEGIKSLDSLQLPAILGQFAALPRGLVLVTGPTGSGKSTTLAAIIDEANRTRSGHIMTIEDPIEFLHNHRGCLVNQREVGADTHSFAEALKHVLRQDPDIILVGELRDLETIAVALTAAETGHLVFATLHTSSAQETITRIVDVFPAGQQAQIRTQLAASLQGVVCQTLCRTVDGTGRRAAVEIMVCTTGIRALIRDDKLQQVQSAMQTGAREGMQTLNQHLAQLVRRREISMSVALEKCSDKRDLATLCGEAGVGTSVHSNRPFGKDPS